MQSEPLSQRQREQEQQPAGAERYEKVIDLESNSTHARVARLVGTGKTVLELGCATGAMSEVFKSRGCTVVGIEIDAVAAEKAKAFCETVIVADLDGDGWEPELGDRQFDVIVAADVLEHLKDPAGVLARLRRFFRPAGVLIVSLPNIGHASVRLSLLAGKFNYTETGLLDRSHLRFFTRETMEDLFTSAGYALGHLERVEAPFDATEIPVDLSGVPPDFVRALESDPNATTYQFVLAAYPLAFRQMELIRERMNALTTVADDARTRSARVEESLRNAIAETGVLRSRIAELERQNDELRQTVRDGQQQNDSLRRQNAELDERAARKSALEQELADLQNVVRQYRNDLTAREAEIASLHHEIQEATARLSEGDARKTAANSRGRAQTPLSTSALHLQTTLKHRTEALSELRRTSAALRDRAENLQHDLDITTGLLTGIRAELDSIHRSRLWKVGSFYWSILEFGRRLGFGKPKKEQPKRAEMPQAVIAPPAELPETDTRTISIASDLRDFAETYRRIYRDEPAILDCRRTGAGQFAPQLNLFEPPSDAHELNYLPASIDLVILPPAGAPIFEQARRIARIATATVSEEDVTIEWLADTEAEDELCASIIIPVFNHSDLTRSCLEAIDATLPPGFNGQVIVVDDASTDDTPQLLSRWAQLGPSRIVIRNEENQGFIDSCNRGAEAATTDLLVFLNNDTVPREGWLTALAETFHTYPDAGAVGAKLLFPDGRLQEAGGYIFSDASGANFGKGDDQPDQPLYNYVREVDYCSGAVLATPRGVFERLGGFSREFRPAYYEDTDYCFRVRDNGMRVLYQPKAVVVHAEGGTSGTDLTAGAKRYQTVNREKFLTRWASRLRQQPAAPDRYDYPTLHRLAGSGAKGRILVINHTVPEWDRESGSKRLYDFLRFLKADGWSVSFMAPWVPAGQRYIAKLQELGVATYEKGLRKLEGDVYGTEAERLIATGDFDVALICFWHIAEQWAPVVHRLSPQTRIVVDSVDLHFLRVSRGLLREKNNDPEVQRKFADEMQRELAVYTQSHRVLTVSEKEAAYINDFAGRDDLAFTVPDCDDILLSGRSFEERRGILFVGSFRHPPNREAVKYLFHDILPRIDRQILEEHPLYIVGTDMDDEIRDLGRSHENVRMVGWVPSLLPYLHNCRIMVLPLLTGAGTKRKFIQASMAGMPSVATTIAAEGLMFADGTHALITDDTEQFARHVHDLIRNSDLWHRLSQNVRERVIGMHGEDAVRNMLVNAITF